MKTLTTFLSLLLFSSGVFAKTTQEVPYFASIMADKANIRTGPSVRYPIQWVYQKPKWPVKITATFEGWRKISDINGEAGWVHEGLLSGNRTTLIQTNGVQEIYRLPILTSNVILIAENGVVAELVSCRKKWCKVKISGQKGWVEAKYLWGASEK